MKDNIGDVVLRDNLDLPCRRTSREIEYTYNTFELNGNRKTMVSQKTKQSWLVGSIFLEWGLSPYVTFIFWSVESVETDTYVLGTTRSSAGA